MASGIDTYLERCAGPIAWGVNDCCIAIADALVAEGRADPMARWRGRYANRFGFHKLLCDEDYSSFEAMLASELGRYEQIENAEPFAVSMSSWLESGVQVIAPVFYLHGWWHARSESGALALPHQCGVIVRIN